MANKIENVIFDMGGVLMVFDGHAFARDFTENDEDAELLWRAYFGRTEWALVDGGVLGFDTLERLARRDLPERLWRNLKACARDWPKKSLPIAETNALVPRLKAAGLGVYLLSNAGVRIGEQLEHMPANKYLDGRVISAFERLMKPDPAIYQLACMRFGIDPATALFVDDSGANCEGAALAGLRSYRFTGDVDALEHAILG